MALGMTLNGAAGETRAAMEQTLALNGLTPEQINQAYRSLIDLLRDLDPDVAFHLANSIWHREGFAVDPAFLDVNRRFFDAEVQALDFADPAAVDVINGWVDEQTRGTIEKIIDQIGANVVMYLINAIYFKGIWQYEFDRAETQDAPFHNRGGSTTTVPMMQMQADLAGPFLYLIRERHSGTILFAGKMMQMQEGRGNAGCRVWVVGDGKRGRSDVNTGDPWLAVPDGADDTLGGAPLHPVPYTL